MDTPSRKPLISKRVFMATLAEVRACTLCAGQLPLPPRPIVQLDPRARILIVGQAPGRKAHDSGTPFNDVSGDRLRAWMGIDRDTFYDERRLAMLPMGFCFPGTGKGGDLPPRPECAPAWRERLLALLPRIELTLVIGRHALDWHLPALRGGSVASAVADWRQHWPRVVPMPHPSPRNQRWLRDHPWLEAEVVPAVRLRVAELI